MDFSLNQLKPLLLVLLILVLGGLGMAGVIDTIAGVIQEVIIDSETVSERWTGVSGDVNNELEFSDLGLDPITTINVEENSGGVLEVDFDAVDDEEFYIAMIAGKTDEIDIDNFQGTSYTEVENGGLFPESNFPMFYEDPGYNEISDGPIETFEENEETIELLDENYLAVESVLEDNIPMHVIKYDDGVFDRPVFLVNVEEYSSCFDGRECQHQFLLPSVEDDYGVYLLSEQNPVEVTTFVNEERTEEFQNPGLPYKFEVETRTVFGNDLVDEDTFFREIEGNNMFVPAIDETGYNSKSELSFETVDGTKEVLIVPTFRQTPEYQIEVGTEKTGVSTTMTVEEENVVSSEDRIEEISMEEYSTEYKEGVNSLRPIADCLFRSSESETFYEIEVSSEDTVELVSGKPFVVNIVDLEVETYRLEESRSHLVMSPVRTEDFGQTVHQPEEDFEASQNALFTPTVPPDEDDGIKITTFDENGDRLYDVEIVIPDVGVCADVTGFETVDYDEATEFSERINAIRPILDSMFVAGN